MMVTTGGRATISSFLSSFWTISTLGGGAWTCACSLTRFSTSKLNLCRSQSLLAADSSIVWLIEAKILSSINSEISWNGFSPSFPARSLTTIGGFMWIVCVNFGFTTAGTTGGLTGTTGATGSLGPGAGSATATEAATAGAFVSIAGGGCANLADATSAVADANGAGPGGPVATLDLTAGFGGGGGVKSPL